MPFKFVAWGGSADVSFWHRVADFKLDMQKLTEEPVAISGFFAPCNQPHAPSYLQLMMESLPPDPGVTDGPIGVPYNRNLLPVPGTLHNTNTVETYHALDKPALLRTAADKIWDDIKSGRAEEDCSLLSRFLVVSYADLKKWTFTYRFAFPGLRMSPQATAASCQPACDFFTKDEAAGVLAACTEWRALPSGASLTSFLLKITPDAKVEALTLKEWHNAQQEGGKVILAFYDPSNLPANPGWPLRNLLALASVRWGATRLQVLCYRENRSGLVDLEHSPVLDIILPATPEWKEPVGWETEKKKVVQKRKVVKDSDEEEVEPVVRTRKKRKSDEFEFEEEADVKPVIKNSKKWLSEKFREEVEERVRVSRKKGKVSVPESEHLLSDGFDGGGDDEDVEMVKEEEEEDEVMAASQDDDTLLTQLSGFQAQDTDEGDPLEMQEQERRIKPRAASTLPIVFAEKINRTKALLECEGDEVDLSGDMGAVGRFTVDHRDNDILLDLKGFIYKTTIVPSNTFFVVNVGQTEAKVEAIMSDFVQLREDTNLNENETMVEGTLQGFVFDSDEEFERPAVEKAGSPEKTKTEEGADDEKETKKKKPPAKAPKSGKNPAKKAVAGKSKAGGKAKVKVGKKPTAKATKTKGSTGKK